MSWTKIGICNMALLQLGRDQIQSIDDSSEEAVACKGLYDITFKSMLQAAEWNFATKTETLSECTDSDYDEEDYDYAYFYPTDCLAALEILPTDTEDEPIEFRVLLNYDGTRKLILTNEADAILRYTATLDNPGLCSPAFINAFAVKLAMALCPKLVSGTDATKLTQLQQYFQRVAWPEALKADSSEGYVKPKSDNPIIEARE